VRVTTARRWLPAGGLLAALAVGCGLSDYQAEMRATQEQVERFDEERQLLGDPLDPPLKRVVTKDTGKEQKEKVISYSFFLRPPAGIRTTSELDPVGGLMYRYPRAGVAPGAKTGLDVPLTAVTPGGFADVFLAFGTEPAAAFVDKVVKALPPNADPVLGRRQEVKVPNREAPLEFEVREFNDARAAWSVWAHTEGNATVAVVFRTEKGKKPTLTRAVEFSLATLAMGPEADKVRDSYATRARLAK
jgi:hypothetical protein